MPIGRMALSGIVIGMERNQDEKSPIELSYGDLPPESAHQHIRKTVSALRLSHFALLNGMRGGKTSGVKASRSEPAGLP